MVRADDDHADDDHADDDHAEEAVADPHIWLSISNVRIWTDTIAKALGRADSGNQEAYAQAAAQYREDLDKLDRQIRRLFEPIEQEQRKLLADHSVLNYFARDYGFTIIDNLIPGISDQTEVSAKHLVSLLERIESENIRAILVGESASRSVEELVSMLVNESAQSVAPVNLLTESLAAEGERGHHYMDLMLYNAENIARALSGEGE